MSTPEIDYFLAAVVDGAGGPQLTSLGEVAFKFTAYVVEFRRRESFDRGCCAHCFRHLGCSCTGEFPATIHASRVPKESYQSAPLWPIAKKGMSEAGSRENGRKMGLLTG